MKHAHLERTRMRYARCWSATFICSTRNDKSPVTPTKHFENLVVHSSARCKQNSFFTAYEFNCSYMFWEHNLRLGVNCEEFGLFKKLGTSCKFIPSKNIIKEEKTAMGYSSFKACHLEFSLLSEIPNRLRLKSLNQSNQSQYLLKKRRLTWRMLALHWHIAVGLYSNP